MAEELTMTDGEAGGIWALEVARPDSWSSAEVAEAVWRWLHALGDQSAGCIFCDAKFRFPNGLPPSAFLFLKPAVSQLQFASLTCICLACADRLGEALEPAAFAFVRAAMPGARVLRAARFFEGGRA